MLFYDSFFLIKREILGGALLKSEIEWSAYLWKFQAKSECLIEG